MSQVQEKMARLLEAVRAEKPLVHQITNYVTVNDCANITLAVGASPVMADCQAEVADITASASALVLNIGTLNERTSAAMIKAGQAANAVGIPVVLDPVGAGASALRTATAKTLLQEVKIAVLRGNISEIKCLAGSGVGAQGVDATVADLNPAQEQDTIALAVELARKEQAVVAITGAIDTISDGQRCITLANGHPMLSQVTGTGCMTTALVAACCGVGIDNFWGAATGIAIMGLAGETAYAAAGMQGTGSFHVALIDAVSRLNGAEIAKGVRYREISL